MVVGELELGLGVKVKRKGSRGASEFFFREDMAAHIFGSSLSPDKGKRNPLPCPPGPSLPSHGHPQY